MSRIDTIKDLTELGRFDPSLSDGIRRYNVETYDEFIVAVQKDLLVVIQNLEDDRASMKKDEDLLTSIIRQGLKNKGWSAIHDAMNGGHVDLIIEFSNHKWKIEAKLNKGASYLFEAYEQIDVYATNKDKEIGFFIYNFNKNLNLSIKKFEQHSSNENKNIKFEEICEDTYTNLSTFKHSSGKILKIKYYWINLYHNLRTSTK